MSQSYEDHMDHLISQREFEPMNHDTRCDPGFAQPMQPTSCNEACGAPVHPTAPENLFACALENHRMSESIKSHIADINQLLQTRLFGPVPCATNCKEDDDLGSGLQCLLRDEYDLNCDVLEQLNRIHSMLDEAL